MIKNNRLILCLLTHLLLCINTYTVAMQKHQTDHQLALVEVKSQLKDINWHSFQSDSNWAYTIETRLDNGNTGSEIQHTKQRFDPSLPLSQQWTLLESGFAKPTPVRLKQYQETQQQILTEGSQSLIEEINIVEFESLVLIDNSVDKQSFSFKPSLPMFDDKLKQVFEGVLIFDKHKQHITHLSIKAKESFSPKLSFKLDRFLLNIDIAKSEQGLHVVMVQSRKTGSAFFFTQFDEKSSKSFSQFKRVM